MRKTVCYGLNTRGPVNFEFPTPQDLLQISKNNIAIKVKDLMYKKSTGSSKYFGGFQLILSNGVSSPVFTCTDQDASGLQSFAIPDYSQVKRINGTNQNDWIHGLSFGKKDGTEITKVELTGSTFGQESVLADDEEIIGIYGTEKVNPNCFA